MRAVIRSFILSAPLVLSFGCGRRDSGAPAPATSDDRFERRFLEVIRTNNDRKRQEALVQIATDAADAGDTANTWKALGWMKDSAGRDDAARNCSLKLAAIGKRDEANLIANHLIKSPELRDKTLAKIAKSKTEK